MSDDAFLNDDIAKCISTNSKKHGKDTNSFETIWLSNTALNKNKRVAKTNTKLIS